ncbi:hypothetical protein U1Q18_045897 [Sarracenia purpurea var. burkii]
MANNGVQSLIINPREVGGSSDNGEGVWSSYLRLLVAESVPEAFCTSSAMVVFCENSELHRSAKRSEGARVVETLNREKRKVRWRCAREGLCDFREKLFKNRGRALNWVGLN